MPILKGTIASQISGHLTPASGYFALATYVCTGNTDTVVTFNSIPDSYTHLQIRAFVRLSVDDVADVTFNNDASGPNYPTQTYALTNGSGIGAGTSGNQKPHMIYGSAAAADTFTPNIIDIIEYKNTTKFKTLKVMNGYNINTTNTGVANHRISYWANQNAITRIDITAASGTFQQYSHFALYGIL